MGEKMKHRSREYAPRSSIYTPFTEEITKLANKGYQCPEIHRMLFSDKGGYECRTLYWFMRNREIYPKDIRCEADCPYFSSKVINGGRYTSGRCSKYNVRLKSGNRKYCKCVEGVEV